MPIPELIAKLGNALTELVQLRITTEVDAKVLQTKIDLVQGDISMKLDAFFLDPAQKWLVDLHAVREKQGAEIVKQTLAALMRLAKLLPALQAAKSK